MSNMTRRSSVKWLKGKKTYIIAVCGIIGQIGLYLQGALSPGELAQGILACLGAITLRAGVAKVDPTADA